MCCAKALLPVFGRPAVAAGSPYAPVITSVSCTITVELDDVGSQRAAAPPAAGDQYTVQIYDDGVLVFSQTQTASVDGETLRFIYTFTSIGTLAPGVGIYVFMNGNLTFDADPYTDIDQSCQATAGCGITEGAYQHRTLTTVQLFWAADETKAVVPPTFIPADQTVSVISNETPGWLKISWACGTYYIQAQYTSANTDPITKPFLNYK